MWGRTVSSRPSFLLRVGEAEQRAGAGGGHTARRSPSLGRTSPYCRPPATLRTPSSFLAALFRPSAPSSRSSRAQHIAAEPKTAVATAPSPQRTPRRAVPPTAPRSTIVRRRAQPELGASTALRFRPRPQRRRDGGRLRRARRATTLRPASVPAPPQGCAGGAEGQGEPAAATIRASSGHPRFGVAWALPEPGCGASPAATGGG